MSDSSSIEWTDATWNPVRGCTRKSVGCIHCYAEIMAARFSAPGAWGHGFAERTDSGARWTGRVELVEDKLGLPLTWGKPRKIFVNSTSDLFHERMAFEDIDRVIAVIALAPEHTFQILTKRPERMREYFSSDRRPFLVARAVVDMLIANAIPRRYTGDTWPVLSLGDDPAFPDDITLTAWPLPNLWLGTSVENQAAADERLPHLLATPAAVRFASCEPLLGMVDMRWALSRNRLDIAAGFLARGHFAPGLEELRPLDWVIIGGETGHGSRPMHPDWVRSLVGQCRDATAPVMFKQWGDHRPGSDLITDDGKGLCVDRAGRVVPAPALVGDFPPGSSSADGWEWMRRVGKAKAGRELDGEVIDEYPRQAVEVRA